ncbi:MAG: hypothetical protein KDC43_29590, partial [Saprospiraceae bacterium]|nr:hypothetical protein [Saprospiraceae bacterium]MCB0683239.1 hypothetical protein [Saprospiraceae bacterium]
ADVEDPTGLTAGTYGVRMVDANGCEILAEFEVGEPSPIVITFSDIENANCAGYETGKATANASGGTP